MRPESNSRKAEDSAGGEPGQRRLFGKPLGIVLIIAQKSIAALFFGALAAVFLTLYIKGVSHPFQRLFLRELTEEPHNRLALFALRHLPELGATGLFRLGLGSLLYGLLEAAEAVGLAFGHYWVEVFVLVETGLFLPIELFELYRHVNWSKLLTLAINLLILWYLVRRYLDKRQKHHAAELHTATS